MVDLGVGALLALIALIVIHGVYATFFGMTITFGIPDLATFLPPLAFGIFFVFMQTATEELVYRGYGMQAVRRFTANPFAMVIMTALLFALVHYHNVVMIGWPWWALLNYALPAVLFGWMVLRTGSLWMPIGWHWLNNFILTRIYATKLVLFLIIAVIVNYLVGRREEAQGNKGRTELG